MEPLSHHLLTQAYNNGWANHRLYKACLQLTQDEFVAPAAVSSRRSRPPSTTC